MLKNWVVLRRKESLEDALGEYLEKGNGFVDSLEILRDAHTYAEGKPFLPCGGVLLAEGGKKALLD